MRRIIIHWAIAIPCIVLMHVLFHNPTSTALSAALAIILSWRQRPRTRHYLGVDWGDGPDKTVMTAMSVDKDGKVLSHRTIKLSQNQQTGELYINDDPKRS